MTLAIHHIAINARDPDRIAALYGDAVGFARVETAGTAIWLAGPNAFVALHPTKAQARASGPRVCDPGIGHFCIQSGAGEAAWARLTASGIAFNARPASLGTGVIYAYGRDPEGNLIETEGVADADAETPPWIAHVALVSADLDRLADFYARLIGRSPHREGTFAHPSFKQITGFDDVRVSAKWIMADNMIFEMWCYHNPATVGVRSNDIATPGYRHVGFCCADLDSEIRRLADVDIVLGPPVVFHDLRAVEGVDPDGNGFIVVEAAAVDQPLALGGLSDPGIVTNRHTA